MVQTWAEKKTQVLSTITNDLSPKGSVDRQIRPLVAKLNEHEGIATTSSCAGRISVFLEGVKRKVKEDGTDGEEGSAEKTVVGGKGAGGRWLYVNHDPVKAGSVDEVVELLFGGVPSEEGVYEQSQDKLRVVFDADATAGVEVTPDSRFVHFKFEPLLLHIQVATPYLADTLVKHALTAGFRESGIMNLGLPPPKSKQKPAGFPIVGIRSAGMMVDSIVGVAEEDGASGETVVRLLVPPALLKTLVEISYQRFEENTKRIARFSELVGTIKPEIQ